MKRWLLAAVFVVVLGPACGGDDPASPGTEPTDSDAGAGRDAHAPAADAGVPTDASTSTDANGTPDSGPIRGTIKTIRFGIIGDYGVDNGDESAVAQLVISEAPEFVVTLGDNNYPSGLASTIDANIGKYYHSFIHPYQGTYGAGATENRFWPCLGNHDWASGTMQPYADYFALPGNERYWDLLKDSVHFFCLDSDSHEPDGLTPGSTQGLWFQNAIGASTAPFKLVLMHHPPYSSGEHGNTTTMQWSYAAYGASAVLAGHDHSYERLEKDGIPYLVQGGGGAALYDIVSTQPESRFSFNTAHSATFARANEHLVVFESLSTDRDLMDVFAVMSKSAAAAQKRSLVGEGATWSFKDDGVAPASDWGKPTFDASAWKTGPALLGYGQVGVKTTVGYGASPSQKHITTWFRKTFDVTSTSDVAWLLARVKKDDGAAIYLNGVEVFRTNLPAGALGASTPAKFRVGYAAEDAWEPIAIDTSQLTTGTNVIAVELHQSAANSSDAMFDLSLDAVLK